MFLPLCSSNLSLPCPLKVRMQRVFQDGGDDSAYRHYAFLLFGFLKTATREPWSQPLIFSAHAGQMSRISQVVGMVSSSVPSVVSAHGCKTTLDHASVLGAVVSALQLSHLVLRIG